MSKCKLCEGNIRLDRPNHDAHVCALKSAIRPHECWQNDTSKMKALCASSLTYNPVSKFEDRAFAFRQIGEAIDKSELHLRNALLGLSLVQRYELMKRASPDLKVKLSPLLADIQSEKLQPPKRNPKVPDDLPEGLKAELILYKERLKRRHDLLIKRGHDRSQRYLSDLMKSPIRLARYLQKKGITSWDAMKKRDIVDFLSENPLVRPTALTRLLRAITEDKPFRERRGRYIRGRAASKSTPLQEVLSPDELEQVLTGIKNTRNEVEYIAAWLVCKLGMSAKAASGLTADLLKLDEDGRLVIRPAKVWVVVPKSVARIFSKIADEMAPGWRTAKDNEYAFIHIFDGKLPSIETFRRDVLGGDARRLRASAVYTAMLQGNLDRVTLNQTMGVSIATITSIERHLSVDIHRKLDPELVAERNKVLRGDNDTV